MDNSMFSIGHKIKFWGTYDFIVKIENDIIETISYNNIPIDEAEICIVSEEVLAGDKIIQAKYSFN